MELNNIWKVKVTQSCTTFCSPMDCIGQNTGVGRCSLLQEIFPPQGSNPGLPHYMRILYQLSHQGSLYLGIFYFHAFIFMFISSNFRDHSMLVHLNLRQDGTWDPLLQCWLLDKLFSPATKYKETIGD